MRRKRGARRLEISAKILDNQIIALHLLFNPLLFQPLVCPSLSPFIPIITIAIGGRHLSHMQLFFTYAIFCIGRELFYFSTRLTPPSGDTFCRIDLFRRQRQHLPQRGRQCLLPIYIFKFFLTYNRYYGIIKP